MMTEPRLIFLGTGSAFPSRSYNECFIFDNGTGQLLVDAGGGNGIINILDREKIDIAELTDMFVTHTHTDHIFGAVWVIRRIVQLAIENKYDGHFSVYGNSDVIVSLQEICRITFLASYLEKMKAMVDFHIVAAGDTLNLDNCFITFIDCHSANVNQTGFRLILPNGQTLCCLGDEALTEKNAADVAGADWLVCGAFCRYADRDVFKPYEKHHLTVADVAAAAETYGIKNLVIVHCEDRTPASSRQTLYTSEAAGFYSGNTIVPEDGTIVNLSRL